MSIAAALGLAVAPATVMAQETEAPAAAEGAASFEEGELRSFAAAAVEVREVRASIEAEMQAAESEAEMRKLGQKGTQRMIQAVEGAEGIGLERYNEIAEAAMQDDALAQKIAMYMTEAADEQVQ